MHFGMSGNCMHTYSGPQAFLHTCRGRALTYMLFVYYVRISGNGASEKNLKDGVCAQFEKNFAKAKWRVWTIYLSIIISKFVVFANINAFNMFFTQHTTLLRYAYDLQNYILGKCHGMVILSRWWCGCE